MSASTPAVHELFLAHPAGDEAAARELHQRLHPEVRVFLASASLRPGDAWHHAIPAAQRASRATVVLISSRADEAWYVGEEIATAIALHRAAPAAHLVIPVLLEPGVEVPYGLGIVQALDAVALGGLAAVAAELRALVRGQRGAPADLPALPPFATPGARRDHKLLLDRLRKAEARFEDLLIHADLDRKLPEAADARFGERVRYVAILARADATLCERLHALLDAHAPWTSASPPTPPPPAAARAAVPTPPAPTSWIELLAAHKCPIAPDEPVGAMLMTAALLRIAAADPRATRADYLSTDHRGALAELTRSAMETLRALTPRGSLEYLPPETAAKLVRALDACSARGRRAGLGHGAPALKAAQVLDLELGANFVHAFRGVTELAPDAPVPMAPFAFDRIPDDAPRAHHEPRAAPSTPTTWLDRVPHLRLAPDTVRRLRVRLRWSDPWLDPVTEDTRFAAVVTSGSLRDDFTWREYALDDLHHFYEVRPRDPGRQRRLVEAAARIARERAASLVIMPELSWTPELDDALRADGALADLPLLVAGSRHAAVEHEEAAGHNLARVYAHGAVLHDQKKLSRYSYVRHGVAYHEHLEAEASDGLDVLIAPGCTAIVLIYNDFVDPVVCRLAEELAPSLLLLPAVTEDPSAFASEVTRLTENHLGFSVVACNGSDRGAALGRPRPARTAVLAPTPTPCVVLFDLDGVHERTDIE